VPRTPTDDSLGWPWRYPEPDARQARDAARAPTPYDETFDASGRLRADWEPLVTQLRTLGLDELRRRWDEARRLLYEHGVSYDAGGGESLARTWNLSPIPVVFGPPTWEPLAAGLAQRARLLDRLLADLYGPQRLIAEGLLPAELVYGHPGFLRPCAGIVPPLGQFLPLYAADVIRGPDGRFAVLTDRPQAPSGVGYALENRIVLSRSLPEAFRDCGVQRLAGFFRTTRDLLRQLAPRGRDNPLIVLLTPGPYSATYFEQAFLAQYLALTLVRGEDLVVRDARVYLKTLAGLKKVDVILRRVNDDFCDPLELRPDSFLGVAGLVESVRAGEVAVVNPLGSGVLQTGAMSPFLPAICRRLLGEDLTLPTVPTYWCGDPRSRSYVESALGELVIKPAFPSGPVEPVFGRELSHDALADLRDRIRKEPSRYVAQEHIDVSVVPSLAGLAGDELAARPVWMRTYAVVAHDGYQVMPGALSRVGGPGARGESKDTWVLASGPVQPLSLLPPPSTPVELSHDESDLPSRIADSLFWLGRYVERAEGTARLVRTIAVRLSDQNGLSDPDLATDLDPLLSMLEAQTYVRRRLDFARDVPGSSSEWPRAAQRGLFGAVFDTAPTGTLRATLAETHRIARTLRDWLSLDAWRAVAHLDQDLRRPIAPSDPSALRALVDLLNRTVTLLAALEGLIAESMTHDQAWRFLDIGRRLERASHVVGLLRSSLASASPREGPVLEALLDIAASATTYRRRYLATLQVCPVVDLLLCDETNPRSALFQLEALSAHMTHLPRSPNTPRTPQQKLVLSVLTELRLADVADLCSVHADAQGTVHAERKRRPLVALLDRVGAQLPALSNSLSAAYFNHAVFTT
jgi:uncharacterized circularly permuted ATP-grasp superfamily protein/uncharacterized alpha-E superfamily protein